MYDYELARKYRRMALLKKPGESDRSKPRTKLQSSSNAVSPKFDSVNLLDELRDLKVGLVSLRDGTLDPTTPAGRLIYKILSSVAAYETEVRKERQMAGIQAVRNRNGGKCPWGGSKLGRRLKVTEDKEGLIKRLHEEGRRITSIARLVGLSRQTC
jgi:DNA invertase Pin-like site-specific DNA recombinase